jgi:hypothetical protein
LEDSGAPFYPVLAKESQILVENVPPEHKLLKSSMNFADVLGSAYVLTDGTPSNIILEEILMADDVGGCLLAGTHSSVILEETVTAGGDNSNAVVSLDESHSSSCFGRAETIGTRR